MPSVSNTPSAGQRTVITDPHSGLTKYSYNIDGQVVSFADTAIPTRITNYEFDPGGRVTTITQPSGMVRSIIYDVVNQVTSLRDRTSGGFEYQRLTMTYDKVGNPVNILDGSGALSTYSYDNANKITNANISAPAFNVTYTYDLAGQAVTSVNGGFTTTYTYDNNGNLSKIVLPWSTTTLTYNKQNRMTVYNPDGTQYFACMQISNIPEFGRPGMNACGPPMPEELDKRHYSCEGWKLVCSYLCWARQDIYQECMVGCEEGFDQCMTFADSPPI